ncbi:hypothetical protein [Rhodococcus sp. UNC363MFTsu5.1]|uniref:hypothetical protein n=1 Tax=Rhodococcus sp. UNC363MFTsu5.1 TaxID=1449069 RepID=UPI0012DD9DF2|nr:hypothetical protein [Rhodococcus sp. UNC363MFTsu5.1]
MSIAYLQVVIAGHHLGAVELDAVQYLALRHRVRAECEVELVGEPSLTGRGPAL